MGDHPHPAGHVPAGGLKVVQLLDQRLLPGLPAGLVEREHMVQHPGDHLHPVALRPAELVHLEPQMVLLRVVGFLQKLGELARLGVDLAGDLPRGGVDLVGPVLHVEPLLGGVLDLLGNGIDRGNFLNRCGQFLRRGQVGLSLEFPEERQHHDPRSRRHAGKTPKRLQPFKRFPGVVVNQPSHNQESHVPDDEGPFLDFRCARFAHRCGWCIPNQKLRRAKPNIA